MLPARWREAKAAGNPQSHPGLGRASKSQFRSCFLELFCPAFITSELCGQGWQAPHHMAPSQGCWSSVDHRLEDAAPQPSGPSCLLRLASSPSELSVLLERSLRSSRCGKGGGFLVCRLGIQSHTCQMINRANVGADTKSGHPG